ncbi:MAG: hypothetical protein JWO37_1186 [Acidimicrobiales bacterium]|jgi:hypothetical protein|nr:hypothetical protein [Acidimicrobiales bacterium]
MRWARRFRVFRYEIRRWRGGAIPDISYAVASPVRVADSDLQPFAGHRSLTTVKRRDAPSAPTGTGPMGRSALAEPVQ